MERLSVMPRHASTKPNRKPEYPEVTAGSRLAAEHRQRANKLTPAERRAHAQRAMAMIYGSQAATETAGPGH